jgi:hypothetical protein
LYTHPHLLLLIFLHVHLDNISVFIKSL